MKNLINHVSYTKRPLLFHFFLILNMCSCTSMLLNLRYTYASTAKSFSAKVTSCFSESMVEKTTTTA